MSLCLYVAVCVCLSVCRVCVVCVCSCSDLNHSVHLTPRVDNLFTWMYSGVKTPGAGVDHVTHTASL